MSGGAHGSVVETRLGVGANGGVSWFYGRVRLNGSVSGTYLVAPSSRVEPSFPGCDNYYSQKDPCLDQGIVFGLMLDGTAEIPLGSSAILLGGGYRLGNRARPYVTAGLWHTPADFDTELGLHLYVARKYTHVAVVMARRLPRRKT